MRVIGLSHSTSLLYVAICVLLVVQFRISTKFSRKNLGRKEAKRKGGRPRLFLHVGPGKMGTTTIQNGIDKDRKTLEFRADNFCPYVDSASFLLWTRDLNRVRYEITPELTERRKAFGAELKKCGDEGLDVVLSSEFLGDVPLDLYRTALEPIFARFEITIVVGYRRYFDWLPSLFFQIVRQRSKGWNAWPEKGKKSDFITFYETSVDSIITKLYTEAYIKNWMTIVGTQKNILIYNVHVDKDLVKTFYCNTLNASNLCKKYSIKHPLTSENVGFSTHFDSIAVAAYHRGLIADPDKITRPVAAQNIQKYFEELNVDASIFPETCFPKHYLEEILEKSKRVESSLVPGFFHSGGKETLEEEFEKKKSKYCFVSVDAILDKYDLSNALGSVETTP